ncbi:MAG: permease [Gemmobacter sp.]
MIAFVVVWGLVYRQLIPFSELVTSLFPVERHSHTGEAIAFFFYDVPKVMMLLTLIVFAMGVVRSYFSPERTRALLAGKREGVGNVMAAGLGVMTPFCSCSAVPLFIGLVSAGVPLGVTFSFLIAAPMVNEVALALLFGLVGWKVAATYFAFGISIAVVAGWVIGKLKLEGWLQDWVRDIHSGASAPEAVDGAPLTLVDRYHLGIEAVREIFGRVWMWIILGIGMGALIHGYVPEDLMVRIMGADAWWSVPAAVVIGIPMYTNAAGVIPIVEALLGKGAALGTVLAFMMSVIALSLPEMIILKQVLTLRLIAVFVGVVGSGILAVGYLFNFLF